MNKRICRQHYRYCVFWGVHAKMTHIISLSYSSSTLEGECIKNHQTNLDMALKYQMLSGGQ